MELMLNVPGLPWTDISQQFPEKFTTSEQIAKIGNMDYNVSAHPMGDDQSDEILGYHSYYRDDTMSMLGVVNHRFPKILQNRDAYKIFEPLMDQKLVSLETAGVFGNGAQTFACFELTNEFKVLDDEIRHYFVAVNDFMKPDGKITIFNTPIRMVCLNMLSHVISKSHYKLRMPVMTADHANDGLANDLYGSAELAINYLQKRAERMVDNKISRESLDKILDTMFPIPELNSETGSTKQIENTMIMRDTFIQCLDVDNLQNYKGTVYWVYNAFVDYAQHYFKSAEKGFDLTYKMNMIPGFSATTDAENTKLIKLTKTLQDMCK